MAAVFHTRNDPLVRSSDGRNFVVAEQIEVVRDDGARFRVPIGATTDGASTPSALWGPPLELTPFGSWWLPAVVHDAGYRRKLETFSNGQWVPAVPDFIGKDGIDTLFNDLMVATGVRDSDRVKIYEGVHLFGWRAFREDGQS